MAKLNCSKCGGEKKGSYIKESWCGTCRNAQRKEKRLRDRLAKGLRPVGSGRDPNCKKCFQPKEKRYFEGSLCGKCKLEKAKIDYRNKRDKEGCKPRRIGRNPICKCGITKENSNEAYCVKCTNERKRDLRAKKKLDPEFQKLERERINKKYAEDYLHRLKRICREATNRRINSGLLVKENCEVCDTNENIQAHHDDYTDPMNVRWMCSWCHAQHHKNLKKEQ